MSKRGDIDYIISDDADILLFGGNNIVKNFTINIKKTMRCIDLKLIKTDLNVCQKDLVKLGISLGSDYCDECPNISINKAFKIIKGIETYKCDIENECNNAIKYFLKPIVNKKYMDDMFFYNIEKKKLLEYLLKFKYNQMQIEKIFGKLIKN